MSIIITILAAVVVFSAVALVAAKVFLKKSWRETIDWLFEFFS
jgi:hypothetical protein